MREPLSDDEEAEDEKEEYYPFGKKKPNKAFKTKLAKYYNGKSKYLKKMLQRY